MFVWFLNAIPDDFLIPAITPRRLSIKAMHGSCPKVECGTDNYYEVSFNKLINSWNIQQCVHLLKKTCAAE